MGRFKRHPQVTKTCQVCGEDFLTYYAWDKKRDGGQKCCSRACATVFARLDFNNWEKFWGCLEVNEDGCWEWPGPYQTAYPDFPYGKVHLAWRERQVVMAHRLAWEIVNGPIPDGLVIRHQCDNPKCCNPDHLLLGTHADNSRDASERGRLPRGNRHFRAKLREEHIPAIRTRLAAGESQQSIADDYGVCQVTISSVATGNTWRHIL